MRKHRLAIIFFVVLVDMLSFSVVLPLLPYLAKSLDASLVQIGLLTAMYPLAQFFGAPILGRLSDRYGRKPILLVSISGTVLGFIVLATAQWLPVLFLGRLLDGLTGGNISVAQAYISDVTSAEDRGKALGLIGAAFGLGFILGPVTGALLSDFSYAAPAWAGAIFAISNLILVATMLPESLSAEDKARLAARPRKGFELSALTEALGHFRVGPLLGIRFATGISFGLFEAGFSLWALSAIGLTARTNGFMLAYVGVLSVIIQAFVIGRVTKRWSDDGLLLTALIIAAAGLTAWGFTNNVPMLVLIMPALSYGFAVTNTVSTSALTKAVHHDEVGGILGLSQSISSLTRIPAAFIPGFLLQYSYVWSPGVVAGVITAGTALYAAKALCWKPGQGACAEEAL